MSKRSWSLKLFIIIFLISFFTILIHTPAYASTYEYVTVKFMSFDGSEELGEASIIKTANATSLDYDEPKIVGYNFVGWKFSPTDTIDGDNQDAKTYFQCDSDMVAYARYEAIKYTFMGNENKEGSSNLYTSVKFTIASGPVYIPDLTQENYIFKGWDSPIIEFDGSRYYIPSGTIGNISCKALWEPKTYTVTFDSQGGTEIQPVKCKYKYSLSSIPTTEKEGYRFVGWYPSINLNGEKLTNTTSIKKNITYYAKWERITYNIEINYRLGRGGQLRKYTTLNYSIESNDIVISPVDFLSDQGYVFREWENESDDNIVVKKGSTGNKVFTAVLDLCQYTLLFDGNNGAGTMNNQQILYTDKQSINENSFIKEGFTFSGWDAYLLDSEGNSNFYLGVIEDKASGLSFKEESTPLKDGSNVLLKAKWTPLYFTIEFYDSDGSYLTEEEVAYGEDAICSYNPIPEEGYAFSGWNPTPKKVTKNMICKARYNPIKVTISLNSAGGKCSKSKVILSYNDYIGKLPIPSKKNHKFMGWYYKDWDGEVYKVEKDTPVNEIECYSIYAKWSKRITIRFLGNQGKCKTKKKTIWTSYKYGKLPTPKRARYLFVGWYTKKKGGTRKYASSIAKQSVKKLYAHWVGPKGKGTNITSSEFKKIKIGQTYKEVKFLIGGSGSVIYESDSYIVYKWKGRRSGSIATVSFEDGCVDSKSQVGLY